MRTSIKYKKTNTGKLAMFFMLFSPFTFLSLFSNSTNALVIPSTTDWFEIKAAHTLKFACRHIVKWQEDITTYIATHYGRDASQFQNGDATRSIEDFSIIMNNIPGQYYSSNDSGCPSINIELGNNHKNYAGHIMPNLDTKRIKSVATCSSSGEIIRWDTYTTISYKTLYYSMGETDCYGFNSQQELTLST